jgi:hypothetical protein
LIYKRVTLLPSGNLTVRELENGPFKKCSSLIYPLTMVIFHSLLYSKLFIVEKPSIWLALLPGLDYSLEKMIHGKIEKTPGPASCIGLLFIYVATN